MTKVAARLVLLTVFLALAVPGVAQAAPSPGELLIEQVASQSMIGALLGTSANSAEKITSISFDRVRKSGANQATVDLTVLSAGGPSVKGKLVLKRSKGTWYFYSITRGTTAGGISTVVVPAGLSISTMQTAIREQKAHRAMLTNIVAGNYRKLSVTSRRSNWNTRQVNVRLTGKTRKQKATTGRVLAYQKTATDGRQYWFISTLK